ncbi:MAG: PH domain-containing protein [Methanobacteriaceae archaeon]|nr:PH domain-containing protein [Methanobacteriaceae archaeon]
MMPKSKKSPTPEVESEYVLLKIKPRLLLYADNFITKIIVLLLLFFIISPAQAIMSQIQTNLMISFNLNITNLVGLTFIVILIAILIVIIKLLLDIMDWNYTTYTFTQSRLVIQRGFLRKEKIFMPYYKIQDIQISQTVMERIFSAGEIKIYGGHDNTETILDAVPNPHDIEELISEQMNRKTSTTERPEKERKSSKYINKKRTKHQINKVYPKSKEHQEKSDKKSDINNSYNTKNKQKRNKYTTSHSIMEKHQSKFNKR